MAVNKVVYVENGVEKTLVDLTADTVTADKLVSGITAHDNSGKQITGTAVMGGGSKKSILVDFKFDIEVSLTDEFKIIYTDENGNLTTVSHSENFQPENGDRLAVSCLIGSFIAICCIECPLEVRLLDDSGYKDINNIWGSPFSSCDMYGGNCNTLVLEVSEILCTYRLHIMSM